MASVLKLPITDRTRRYGYIYWPAEMDDAVHEFFERREVVTVFFMQSLLGSRKVDRQYRRLSIGLMTFRALIPPAATTFRLAFKDDGRLHIVCL